MNLTYQELIDITDGYCLHDILNHFNIELLYKDLKGKTVESVLLIDDDGYATIFVRPDLPIAYENFLIAHELGHYILHYDTNVKFNFLSRVYKTRIEQEANIFACALLLHDCNFNEYENIEFLIQEKGIPLKIWYSIATQVCSLLQLETNF